MLRGFVTTLKTRPAVEPTATSLEKGPVIEAAKKPIKKPL
jgi:hypothetical protein